MHSRRVKANKGAHGIDGMEVDELLQYLKENGRPTQAINPGWKIPSESRSKGRNTQRRTGKKRKLGIPTVVDRVIQQAIAQVLTPIYEKQFSDNSFGFRPKRSAHDAMRKCQENIQRRIQICSRHGFGEIL